MKNKNKIVEIDKALVQLQDKIRHSITREETKKPGKSESKLPSINQEEIIRTNQQSDAVLKDLDKMQL